MRGFTLLEVVVSVILVAVALVVIVGLVPMGANAQRKADDIQAATLYATEVLEDAERPEFRASGSSLHFERVVTMNGTPFLVVRDVYGMDGEDPPHLYDVVVRVTWRPQPAPIELRTRVYHP